MAKVIIQPPTHRYLYSPYNWLQLALLGAALGVLTWALGWAIGAFAIDPLLCRASSELRACAQSGVVAGNVAAIMTAVLGAFVLIRLHVRWAIAVVFAVVVLFWGSTTLLAGLAWGEVVAWMAALYALAYTLFSQIFRVRSVVIACIAAAVAVLALRLIAFV